MFPIGNNLHASHLLCEKKDRVKILVRKILRNLYIYLYCEKDFLNLVAKGFRNSIHMTMYLIPFPGIDSCRREQKILSAP